MEYTLDQEDRTFIETISNICAIICEINEIYEDEANKEEKKEKEKIDKIIINILDQVRFLFKSKDYEHENEMRLIKFSEEAECDADGEIPYVFIRVKKDIRCKEVVLGPKANINIAPYLHYTGKVKKVTLSNIRYR